MKKLFFIIFNIISYNIYSLKTDSLKKLVFKNQTHFSVGSTHLKKSFFNKLYFGGHLNNDDKGELNSINELQRSGFELDLNFGAQFFLNEEKWYVNFQNIITSAGKYEQGLFDLIFRGNTRLNKEISLSKTAFHYRNHHLFHFGKYFNFGSVGFTLGSINQEYNIKFKEGDNLNLIDPYRWQILGNPDILFIDNTTNFLQKNGNSLGIDFEISNLNLNEKINYNLAINNFGAILLHRNLQLINYDTSFTYSGLSLNQILNADSSLNLINDFKPKTDSTKRLFVTPFHINTNLNFIKNNYHYYAEIFYRHNSQYLPKVSLGMNYTFKNKIILGSLLSYGGYTKLQVGINSEFKFQKFNAKFIIQNFANFIYPLNRSFGFLFNLSYNFINY